MNILKSLFSHSSATIKLLSESIIPFPMIIQCRNRPVYKPIRGPPIRPLPRNKFLRAEAPRPIPQPSKYGWRPILPIDGKYTIEPLKIQKMGGRDPATGKVVVKTIGGGNKKYYRWIDIKRIPNSDGSVKEEKVLHLRYDPLRTAKLALVGAGDTIRWITAGASMQKGDIIRTYAEIPRNPVSAKDGDSHPVGALPIGTLVHNIETEPRKGGVHCKAAGTAAEIVRRIGKKTIIQLPNKRQEIAVDQNCMATVGRVSNIYHHTVKWMCAQRMRWKGKRQCSGLWHRKDGYCGRKAHPPKPLRDFTTKSLIGRKKNLELYEIQPF